MENYIVSARKYRPESFQTVIGQPAITTTLKNAIKNRQLAHAYLFCGPRGVGKTTCARIFAKTINCFNITDNTEACNKCESCNSFNTSRSYNIHELDAASNNSVEDIRVLIEQIRIPPQIGKYSIYIIDEVHMLSTSAFNAFLKTLEEPPRHAIFILATTEKQKILPTILSRCQIFDFHRIKIEDIVSHLESISRTENIDAETEGLNIIAQKAEGAMRDALSIFDQIVSFSGGKITYENVINNLNILDYEYHFNLTDAILQGDLHKCLMIFNEILDKGFEGHNFINGLSRHFRDLLVCKDTVTLELLEVGALIREKYRSQSAECPASFLINALSVTNQCDLAFRSSRNQRLHVELCLVQLCGLTSGEKKNSGLPQQSLINKELTGKKVDSGKTLNKNDRSGTKETDDGRKNTDSGADKKDPGAENKDTGISTSDTAAINTDEGSRNTDSGSENTDSGADKKDPGAENKDTGADKKDTGEDKKDTGTSEKFLLSASVQGNGRNTLSIKDAIKGTKPPEPQETEGDILDIDDNDDDVGGVEESNIEFTEKDLAEQWKKFANQIRNKHPRLFNTLLANKPTVTDQVRIEFELSNPLEEEALNKIKPELIRHLRNELNSNLELHFKINENLRESKLYLPEDKFEHMARKNPDLTLFKHKFNLDFE